MKDMLEIMKENQSYTSKYDEIPSHLQEHAQKLTRRLNQCEDEEERVSIMKELFGTYNPLVFIKEGFKCDYGFNIHFHGLAIVNYNCVMLDTSPINIGHGAYIAPGVCFACSGHALLAEQRRAGVCTSGPITLENDVWIGANATICAGVTIGEGSVIGAGSVVTKDIPAGVVAAGVPCRVLRKVSEKDRIEIY